MTTNSNQDQTTSSMLRSARECMAYHKQVCLPNQAAGPTWLPPKDHTPGLWKHQTQPITFCLIVDDFAIKYVRTVHAQHLLVTLQEHYKITIDWDTRLFIGITLNWEYNTHMVTLSMPGYITSTLKQFNHPTPTKPEHCPYKLPPPQYGVRVQMMENADTTP